MTAKATGALARVDDRDAVVFERTFSASIEDVWAAVTESDRLERWIGTWTGDPASGSVDFTMNAEGEEVQATVCTILDCTPPRRLALTASDQFGTWELVIELTESRGVVTLLFAQLVNDPSALENTGPGWDYYLDRLVVAEAGGDVSSVNFDRDYYPALREHYLALTAALEA